MTTSKTCNICRENKPLQLFNTDKKGKFGKSYRCKECKKKATEVIQKCTNCSIKIAGNLFRHKLCRTCRDGMTEKECNSCKETKTLEEYYDKKNGFLDKSAICKDCEVIKVVKSMENVKTFLKVLLTASKHGICKKKLSRILEHTIVYEDLESLYKKQNGNCYYSGIKMNLGHNVDWKCSIERINTDIGYTASNIVLCCSEFNSRVQWSLDKVQQLHVLVNQENSWINNIDVLTHQRLEIKCSCIPENVKKCNKCRGFQYRNSLRGHIHQILNKCKYNTSNRKSKGRSSGLCCDITFNEIIELLIKQRGLCAYSKLPLNYEKGDWRMSIERINTFLGYTKDNILIVASEFNTTDCTVMAKHNITGSGGWTLEKFQFYLKSQTSI